MLKIRGAQLAELQRALEERDAHEITVRMLVALPHVALAVPAESLHDAVIAALRRGRELGMRTLEGCQALARLFLEIGPGCESIPELAAVLADATIDPDLRAGIVLQAAPAAAWRRRLEEM